MKKIKVALLIDEFFGGAGTAFGGYGFLARKYIAKYIPGKDLQIDVLLELDKKLEEASAEKVDNVMVYRLPGDKQKAKDWLKSQKYDLYLSIEMTWPSHEIMELVEDKNLVLWIQDPRPEKFWETKRNSMSVIQDPCVCDNKVSDLIRKMNYQGRVKFISQGYSLNPLAQELYGLQDDFPVDYVPNPIEIDFNFEFDLSKKKKQVIFLGRLEAQKRAWIFCEIAKKMPEYDFYVMGKFFRYEDENKKILEPYMNGNIPNLHFMGHMDGEEKEQLIKESRVLLNTSIWEGIPISWLECLQYGTTVVSCLDNENLPSRFGSFVGEVNGDGFESADLFVPAIKKLMEDDEYYKEKATASIKYIRKYHNIEKFRKNMCKYIKIMSSKKVKVGYKNVKVLEPARNYLDVKVTYACNYKCEYCYQVDDCGVRAKGMLSKENAKNLVKFVKKLNKKFYITLAGGEPFVYPYLEYLGANLAKLGNIIDIITNFSAPFEKIEKFIRVVGHNMGPFSISIHLSQIDDMEIFYAKLEQLINLKNELNLNFPILLTCVLTPKNFEKLKIVDKQIKERFDLPLEIQRVYHNGVYTIYNEEIEAFMNERGLDVPIEKANNIDFYGHLCWAGSRFFYIESNGDVRRCYTNQQIESVYKLGNLQNYKAIKTFEKPIPCFTSDCGNCVCWKHFVRQKFLTDYICSDQEIKQVKQSINYSVIKHIKYYAYRLTSNFTIGKLREKLLQGKNKYKEILNNEES